MRETAVLVEGESDRVTVETLAGRLGRNLPADRVNVVSMGGATNIVHFLDRAASGQTPYSTSSPLRASSPRCVPSNASRHDERDRSMTSQAHNAP